MRNVLMSAHATEDVVLNRNRKGGMGFERRIATEGNGCRKPAIYDAMLKYSDRRHYEGRLSCPPEGEKTMVIAERGDSR